MDTGWKMAAPLELELKAYDRERARLESQHRGRFVVIRGAKVAAIFDDFESASEYAARFRRKSYLIHRIAADVTRTAVLLRRLADIRAQAPR